MSHNGQPEPQSPTSPVLVVGPPDRREVAVAALAGLGWASAEADDPYAAMSQVCRHPADLFAVVLSLHGLYREELQLVQALKRVQPGIEVWLTDIDARPATLAEAMRLGADGLLGEDGLHRLAVTSEKDDSRWQPSPAGHPESTRANGYPAMGSRDVPGTDGADEPPTGRAVRRARREANGKPSRMAVSAQPWPAAGQAAAETESNRPAAHAGAQVPQQPDRQTGDDLYAPSPGEPILSAEELRALLQDPDPAAVSGDPA